MLTKIVMMITILIMMTAREELVTFHLVSGVNVAEEVDDGGDDHDRHDHDHDDHDDGERRGR